MAATLPQAALVVKRALTALVPKLDLAARAFGSLAET
jgi:hypothetical protein